MNQQWENNEVARLVTIKQQQQQQQHDGVIRTATTIVTR